MERLLDKSESLVDRTDTSFKRYLYDQINWKNRLIGIKGARGTGKTTLLFQYMKLKGLKAAQAVYFSMDDMYFTAHPLVETVDQFYKQGGKFLFLDEVHKYPDWARTIKNLYDTYPDLKIVFTGSSIIELSREEGDLSRRARMYELHGLSFREFLKYEGILEIPAVILKDVLGYEKSWRKLFPPDFRPYQHFNPYLSYGYYPFFKEDREGYANRLQQLIRTIVEYDMAELKDFDIRNAKKLLQLLYILSENVPFKPNLSSLAEKSNIHRNSLNSYLNYLQEGRLIDLLYPSGISVATLQKPEKIYLHNTNLAYALSIAEPEKGNLRETFFLNQLRVNHKVHYPAKGDFVVDGNYTFEIGGKHKNDKQLKDIKKGYVVNDDIEYPVGNHIPLWLFGFLY